jgi:CRP-like cAMP-binding protein
MPKIVDYKAGSIVYFQGDRSDKIYIVQNGHVYLKSMNLEGGQSAYDPVSSGEFFGVKSALGSYPREETATSHEDSKIMVFTIQEFEALCMSNTRITMQMLKVFSTQLRTINKQLQAVTIQKEVNTDDGLYGVGEFYLKQSKYDKSYYVLSKYISAFPEGKNIVNAKKNMSILERMKNAGEI